MIHELHAPSIALPATWNDGTTELIGGGLNYHGWYVRGFPNNHKTWTDYGGEQRNHPWYRYQDINAFENTNTIWLRAPDAPDSVAQPAELPEGAEWLTGFYYLFGDPYLLPKYVYWEDETLPGGLRNFYTGYSSSQINKRAWLWSPKRGRVYLCMACSQNNGGPYTTLAVFDRVPHENPADGLVFYQENFFPANPSLACVMPGDGSRAGFETDDLNMGEAVMTLAGDTVSAQFTVISLADIGYQSQIGDPTETVKSGGKIQVKAPKLVETSSSVEPCDGGGSQTLKQYEAGWTDPTEDDATYTRTDEWETKFFGYGACYINGVFTTFWGHRLSVAERTRSYTYNASGGIHQSLNAAACTVNTTGLATWEVVRSDAWEVTQTLSLYARTIGGDSLFSRSVATYTGTYAYTAKSKAENSTGIGNDPANTTPYDYSDTLDVSVTGQLGGLSWSWSGSYLGDDPNESEDLLVSPMNVVYNPGSQDNELMQTISVSPITNMFYQNTPFFRVGRVANKARLNSDQGINRSDIVSADDIYATSTYVAYVGNSGPGGPLSGNPITTWADSFVDGHYGNHDNYPYWDDRTRTLRHRFAGTYTETIDAGRDTYPSDVLAIWL